MPNTIDLRVKTSDIIVPYLQPFVSRRSVKHVRAVRIWEVSKNQTHSSVINTKQVGRNHAPKHFKENDSGTLEATQILCPYIFWVIRNLDSALKGRLRPP